MNERRRLFEQIARAIFNPDEPARGQPAAAIPVSATPASGAPETSDEIEQRLMALLTGGTQDRRGFLGRVGGLISGMMLAGPVAGKLAASRVQEAAALYRACNMAGRKITILHKLYPDSDDGFIKNLISGGADRVREKMEICRLDKLIGTEIVDLLNTRNKASIERFVSEYEKMIGRAALNRNHKERLRAFIAQTCPGQDPDDIIYPELPEMRRKYAHPGRDALPDPVPPKDFLVSMRENLAYVKEYQHHYRNGTLMEWFEGKNKVGHYEGVKDKLEGMDYKPRYVEPEIREKRCLRMIDEEMHKEGIKVDLTLNESTKPTSAVIRGTGHHTHYALMHVARLLRRAYQELAISERDMDTGHVARRWTAKDVSEHNAPRLLVSDPPPALQQLLQNHARWIIAGNEVPFRHR